MAFKMKGHTLKGPQQKVSNKVGMRQEARKLPRLGEAAGGMMREQTPHLTPAKPDMARVKAGKEEKLRMAKNLRDMGNRDTRKPTEPKRYTKKEHEANKANNAAIDKEMLAYRKAYSDLHGSSSGGSDEEYAAHQAGLTKLRAGYVDR